MAVKLELYRVFRAVAEAESISQAAQELYISQSAVSQSIRNLEDTLKTRLFVRSTRGVRLTDEGRLLYDYVRSAMSLLETGENKLAQTQSLLRGTLVIGASDTVTAQFLLPYLERFHHLYPSIHLQSLSGRSQKVLGLLRSGRIDIAFASTPPDTTSLLVTPCFQTHAIFVAGSDYACDFTHEHTLAEIGAFPLILLERKASSRVYLERYFLENGLRLTPEIELGSRSLLVDLARIGFGVAGVTEEFVTDELASGVIRKLPTAFTIPPRSVDMCILRDVPPTATAQRFMELVCGSAPKDAAINSGE